jgi:asparagine synthase (glutamine-hydrolysing)
VERRLVADVPLGAFLSGGFDSGLVVAAMARLRPRVRTFTAGTPKTRFDERDLAASVAARWGTDHTGLAIAPTNATVLPRLLADVGQPFGDSSLLPSFEVAKAARQFVTVVLTGDGGDESFFGYTLYQGILAASFLRRTLPFPGALGAASRLISGEGVGSVRRRVGHVLRLASGTPGAPECLYNHMGFDPGWRRSLLREPVRRAIDLDAPEGMERSLWRASDAEDEVERYASVFMHTTLIDTYLVKVDTATMATSLEARCPFLDVDLIDFMARVPRRLKFPSGRRKHLMRPLVRRDLPPELLKQPKRGFSVPVGEWLRAGGALRPTFDRLVLGGSGAFAELIDGDAVRRLQRVHDEDRGEGQASRLWTLFSLAVWAAVAVDHSMSPDDPLGA